MFNKLSNKNVVFNDERVSCLWRVDNEKNNLSFGVYYVIITKRISILSKTTTIMSI